MKTSDSSNLNTPMDTTEFSETAVNDQLEKVLASDTFRHSKRMETFLRYVVSETLAGRSDRLKEFSIAQEVFQRDETFDPKESSVVRVEANRLRTRLKQYYDDNGADDDLLIEIPKGGYVSIFKRRPLKSLDDTTPGSLQEPEATASKGEVHRIAAILVCTIRVWNTPTNSNVASALGGDRSYSTNLASEVIKKYSGQIVDATNEDLLLEFPSADDALLSALEIESALLNRNTKFVESEWTSGAFGIDIGKVIDEGGRISGQAVEEARHMLDLCGRQGICVSGSVYDQTRRNDSIEYSFLGGQVSGDGERRYRAYSVEPVGGSATGSDGSVAPVSQTDRTGTLQSPLMTNARRAMMMLALGASALAILGWVVLRPLTEKTRLSSEAAIGSGIVSDRSIAVFPFSDLSPGQAHEEIAESVSQEVIALLSKRSELSVKSHDSSHAYRGKALSVVEFARDMNVRYVLDGSITRTESFLHITAQLVDAASGNNIWSEVYDYEISSADSLLASEQDTAESIADNIADHRVFQSGKKNSDF